MKNYFGWLVLLNITSACGLMYEESSIAPIKSPTPIHTVDTQVVRPAQPIQPPQIKKPVEIPGIKTTSVVPTPIILQTTKSKFAIIGDTFKKLVRYATGVTATGNATIEMEITVKTLGKINLGLVTESDQIILTGLDIKGVNQLISFNPADFSEMPLLKDDIEITALQNVVPGQLTFTGTRFSDYNTVDCSLPLANPAKYRCQVVPETAKDTDLSGNTASFVSSFEETSTSAGSHHRNSLD
jgi:hypothetical protein